jgi:hypothetical protein
MNFLHSITPVNETLTSRLKQFATQGHFEMIIINNSNVVCIRSSFITKWLITKAKRFADRYIHWTRVSAIKQNR